MSRRYITAEGFVVPEGHEEAAYLAAADGRDLPEFVAGIKVQADDPEPEPEKPIDPEPVAKPKPKKAAAKKTAAAKD